MDRAKAPILFVITGVIKGHKERNLAAKGRRG